MTLAALSDHFALAAAWPWLALAPLCWLALVGIDRQQHRRRARLLGPRAGKLTADVHWRNRRRRRLMFAAGLLCAIGAALQPQWGSDSQRLEQRGVDLIVCLDVSRSMLARDVPPSRLAAARQHVRALAERARGDRLGLVAFAGEARLIVPLTQDVDTFLDLLDQADPVAVRRGGTDLGAALECALAALHSASGDHEAILLVTDGEDHEQRGLRLATAANERGVVVHAVGVGSPRGSKITVEGERGEAFLRDKTGSEVVSAMDVASLQQIAAAGGGDFVDLATSAQPLVELYDRRVVPMARKALAIEQRRERKNQFQWPLLAALLIWVWELILLDRARSARTANAPTVSVVTGYGLARRTGDPDAA